MSHTLFANMRWLHPKFLCPPIVASLSTATPALATCAPPFLRARHQRALLQLGTLAQLFDEGLYVLDDPRRGRRITTTQAPWRKLRRGLPPWLTRALGDDAIGGARDVLDHVAHAHQRPRPRLTTIGIERHSIETALHVAAVAALGIVRMRSSWPCNEARAWDPSARIAATAGLRHCDPMSGRTPARPDCKLPCPLDN